VNGRRRQAIAAPPHQAACGSRTPLAARRQARQAICQNRFKQTGLALTNYAMDHREALPGNGIQGDTDATIYYLESQGRDLVPRIGPYICETWELLECPFVSVAAPLDDPANTGTSGGTILKFTRVYFWGLEGAGGPLDVTENTWKHEQKTPWMADIAYQWNGVWRSTHNRGGALWNGLSVNPSLAMFIGGEPEGANYLFADGHVAWTPREDLSHQFTASSGSEYWLTSEAEYE